MIESESGYRWAMRLLSQIDESLRKLRADLLDAGESESEFEFRSTVKRHHREVVHKRIIDYEVAIGKDRFEFRRLADLGWRLVQLRIAAGVTQRELAKRLGIHESGISHAERNGYRGISLDRADRILRALRVRLDGTVKLTRSRQR